MTRYITFRDLPEHGVPPYSRKHVLDLMRQRKFPLARQLSANRVGWDADEIAAWVANRPVARSLREPEAPAEVTQPVKRAPSRFTRRVNPNFSPAE